jgi:hypothetical protein
LPSAKKNAARSTGARWDKEREKLNGALAGD